MGETVPKIETRSDSASRVGWLNEIYIGKLYSGENYLDSYLSWLDKTDADALVITGGIFYIDTKRHSSKKNRRALTSEAYVNDEDLKKNIPGIVKRDDLGELEELLDGDGEDVGDLEQDMYDIENMLTSYASSNERKTALKRKIGKAFEKNADYSIPIYGIFGANEENFIESSANDELRKDVKGDQSRYRNKITKLEYLKKIAYKRLEKEREEEDGDTSKIKSLSTWIKRLTQGIDELESKKSKIIMSNKRNSERQDYIHNAKQRLKSDIMEVIPNFEWLPQHGKFRVNNALVNASYNNYKISNYPLLSATKKLRDNIGRRIYEGRAGDTRLFVQGGLQGVFSAMVMLDTDDYSINELPIGIHTPEEHDRNVFAVQLPPFMDKECLRDILEEEVLIPAGAKPQKMLHKIPNIATGAVVTDFLTSDGSFVTYNYLTPEFLEEYEVNGGEAEPELISFISRGDDHIGSQHNKLVLLPTQVRKRAEKVLDYELMNNLFRINRGENAVYNLFRPESVFHNGDNVQGMNYSTMHVEKFKDKNMYSFSKDLSDEELQNLSKRDVVLRALCEKYWKNTSNMEDQLEDFIGEMVDLPEEQNRNLIKHARKLNLEGPVITYVGGGHTKKTFSSYSRPTGFDFNKTVANIARRTYNATEEEVTHGTIGSGAGYLAFQWGLRGNLYDVIQKHKWSSTHKGQLNRVLGKAAVVEQRQPYFRLGGHTHQPLIGRNGQEFVVINGSAQDNNEWKEMFNLPPSTTSSWWVNTPAKGNGPVRITPLTLELIMKGLTHPEKIKKVIDDNFNFYSK